jgi:hypothetical protein
MSMLDTLGWGLNQPFNLVLSLARKTRNIRFQSQTPAALVAS